MASTLTPDDAAGRHRVIAATFADRVAGAQEAEAWSSPTPVSGWAARDVLSHLIDWLPGLLASGSEIRLAQVTPVEIDPVAAWAERSEAVQQLLDDPEVANSPYTSAMFGDVTVAQLINQFYVTDVFMHTWDLARATGQSDRLDEEIARDTYAAMKSMETMVRESGQFGDQQPVPPDADATDELMAFIGRDPRWRSTAGSASD